MPAYYDDGMNGFGTYFGSPKRPEDEQFASEPVDQRAQALLPRLPAVAPASSPAVSRPAVTGTLKRRPTSASERASAEAERVFDGNGRDQYGLSRDGSRDPDGGVIARAYLSGGGTIPSVLESPRQIPDQSFVNQDARLPAWYSAPGFSRTTDPETGYSSYSVASAGRFPGFRATQLGEHLWETEQASTLNGVQGGWGPLQTSRYNLNLSPDALSIPQMLQANYNESNPKQTSGQYQSRLFDSTVARTGAPMSVSEAQAAAAQWARNFHGGRSPVAINASDEWRFSGNQPVSNGYNVGYSSGGTDYSTSLSNPDFMPRESPDQYDVAAYEDYLSGRRVQDIGPSKPRPGSTYTMMRHEQPVPNGPVSYGPTTITAPGLRY